jgi:hypothetical protein
MLKNVGKMVGKWWKMVEHAGKCWKMVENAGK